MENLYSQQSAENAASVTRTHQTAADTAAEVVAVASEVTQAAAAVTQAATVPGTSTEQKVSGAVQTAGTIAEVVVPEFAPVIAAGVELEPEMYHLISALIHIFKKRK